MFLSIDVVYLCALVCVQLMYQLNLLPSISFFITSSILSVVMYASALPSQRMYVLPFSPQYNDITFAGLIANVLSSSTSIGRDVSLIPHLRRAGDWMYYWL